MRKQSFDATGTETSSFSYTYDRDGNRLSRNGEHHVYSHGYCGRELALTYDSFDKVKSVTTLGGTRSTTFDGEGRRVGIVDSDGSRNVMESDAVTPYDVPLAIRNGASETTYVYAGEHASSRTHILADGTSATRYYLRDAMGSVMGIVDESGNVVASFAYDAFGRTLLASGAEANASSTAGDFRFHGMWQDPSGLYYVRARSYDPETGRFLTKDPVEPDVMQPETWHPYAYGRNAPTAWRDPDGRFSLMEINVGQIVQNELRSAPQTFARDVAVDRVQAAAGTLVASAIGHMMPIVVGKGIPPGTIGGKVFEELAGFNLCGFLPSGVDTAAESLYLEVPMGRDGRPSAEGYHCPRPPPSFEGFRAGIAQVLALFSQYPRPDFIYSERSMADVADHRARTLLVGDFKLNVNNVRGTEKSRNQLTLMSEHAADYGRHILAYVSLSELRPDNIAWIQSQTLRRGTVAFIITP